MNKQEQTRLQRATQAKLRFVCCAFLERIGAHEPGVADRIAEDTASAADYLFALDILERSEPESAAAAAPKPPATGTGKPGRPRKVPPESAPDVRQTTLETTTSAEPSAAGETSES